MPQSTRPVRDGVVIGLIAYLAVAAFYALFDFLAARGPLFTVNLLGLALFRGARDAAILQTPIALDAAAITAYNAVHLALSLAIGLVVMALVGYAERRRAPAPAATAVIVIGFVVTILAVGFLSRPIRPVLPWWSIVVANSLAVLLAGGYLLRSHPGLWRRMMPILAGPTAGDRGDP
jgi:hypothetical protein